ncbi:hypothetical protein IWX48DRAFT_641755 [Phyllosticta citricarpa]
MIPACLLYLTSHQRLRCRPSVTMGTRLCEKPSVGHEKRPRPQDGGQSNGDVWQADGAVDDGQAVVLSSLSCEEARDATGSLAWQSGTSNTNRLRDIELVVLPRAIFSILHPHEPWENVAALITYDPGAIHLEVGRVVRVPENPHPDGIPALSTSSPSCRRSKQVRGECRSPRVADVARARRELDAGRVVRDDQQQRRIVLLGNGLDFALQPRNVGAVRLVVPVDGPVLAGSWKSRSRRPPRPAAHRRESPSTACSPRR